MGWVRKHRVLIVAYAICACSLASRVPMTGLWSDVWLPTLFPGSHPVRVGTGDIFDHVAPDKPAGTSPIELSYGDVEGIEPRWGLYARRQAFLALALIAVYFFALPFPARALETYRWADRNDRSLVAFAYLLAAAYVLIYPPCNYHHLRGLPLVYHRLDQIGFDSINGEVLALEQVALAVVAAAVYLGYCAIRSRSPFARSG